MYTVTHANVWAAGCSLPLFSASDQLSCRTLQIDESDLRDAEQAVGQFGGDNRAGVPETLHRISAMRNRKGKIVGMTCRVGRAVLGHVDMIRDLLDGEAQVCATCLHLGRGCARMRVRVRMRKGVCTRACVELDFSGRAMHKDILSMSSSLTSSLC